MSVRDRIERAQRLEIEAKLDVGPKPVKALNSTTNQGGTGMSTREAAERAAFNPDDPIIRNNDYRHGGRTTVVQYVGTVRERLERQRDEQQEVAEVSQPATNAVADFYHNEYLRDESRKKADEAVEDKRNQERIAQNQWNAQEPARRAAAEKQRQEERVKMLAVDLMFTSAGATPQEIKKITELVTANCPQQKYNHEIQWRMLMELRDALGGNISNPGWTDNVMRRTR